MKLESLKRDPDLIRKILIEIEDRPQPDTPFHLEIEDYLDEEISYHVELLDEAGLIHAYGVATFGVYEWNPIRLTWEGHEFLDTARDEDRWNNAKSMIVKKGGDLAFSVLTKVLVNLMTEQVLA